MTNESLVEIVERFRDAADEVFEAGGAPEHMRGFPRGCCGVMSDMLGEYLNSLGIGVFLYVRANRAMATHAWVELDGIVIDITSDQFQGRPRVYVGEADAWYKKWKVDAKHLAEHCPAAMVSSSEHEFYEKIMTLMTGTN
ncbi:hypothetical protein [Pseudomonas sp. XWY-1]|uniref:hypothetical protein n=1 Tax=Pseudomonas sp. XWY-1 TaxID=2069256 RepID=UPI001319C168|nr:hypothetical protein [Pseudomonas sp. XWY-1]